MAPLFKALEVTFHSKDQDGSSIYCCDLDSDWAVGMVPQGGKPRRAKHVSNLPNQDVGYSLGPLVEALIQHQITSDSSHTDPVHITAHFLRATSIGRGEVQIKLIKTGKAFTNLQAQLVQNGTVKIMAHVILGDLSPEPSAAIQRTLSPPSPYARRLPLNFHPSVVTPVPIRDVLTFGKDVTQWSIDPTIIARNQPDNPARTTNKTVGGGGTEWGAWCELTEDGDKLKVSSIPFFADTFLNMPILLPECEPAHAGADKSWFPTITMSIEFKTRIPSSAEFSDRTVGLYFESRFFHDPHGRHNARVEVWTAPSGIGQGNIEEGWREKQYCIAVADQMALMLPMDLNLKEGRKGSAKL